MPPTVTVLTPNSTSITWTRNTTQTMTWSSSGNPGAYLKIELLKGGSPVKTIAAKASTALGAYTWKVPPKQAAGSDYTIRITSTTNGAYTDTSDTPFSIK